MLRNHDKDYDGYVPSDSDTLIAGYRLICTCGACPEQYDVFDDTTKKLVGYLRLRHGYFRADYPDVGGETVYEAEPDGDGIFEDYERLKYLTEAVAALQHRHKNDTNKTANS